MSLPLGQFKMGKRTGWSLRYEDDRLSTYVGWTAPVSAVNLAAAGFYYLKKSDRTRCPFCGIILHEWKEHDDPLQDHRKWSKYCPFIEYLDQLEKLPLIIDEVGREKEQENGCGCC